MKKILRVVIFLTVLSSVSAVFAQVPVLSYPSGAKSYTAGTAITALALSNAGGAIPGGFYGQVLPYLPNTYATGMVVDTIHNVFYIAYGQQILKVNPNGTTSVLAGRSNYGAVNGTGSAASFYNPAGLAVDAAGYIYVADQGNNMIRKISPNGVVTTLAGNTVPGNSNAKGALASFSAPSGLAVDKAGNVYVADQSNNLIRKIDASGNVTTVAGSGTATFADGNGTAASFYNPVNVIVDNAGNLYVSDQYNNRIRKIDASGNVTTLAGNATGGYGDGTGVNASFYYPRWVAFDAAGNILVADYENNYLRKVTPAGVVTTITSLSSPQLVTVDGSGNVFAVTSGVIEIPLTGYAINPQLPAGLSLDPSTGTITGTPLLAINANNYTVTGYNLSGSSTATLNITVTGTINIPPVTVKAPNISYASPQSYTAGTAIANLSPTNTNGGAVPGMLYGQTNTLTSSSNVTGLAMDAAGNIYFNTGTSNNQVKKISSAGVLSVVAGTVAPGLVNGTGTAASFNNPQGLAIDAAGNLYVADANNNVIRKITPAGVVTTLAGNGSTGYVDGAAASASFNGPAGIAVDAFGNVYVSDYNNYAIRMISPNGVVKTLAGGTYGAVNGTGKAASFEGPQGIIVDPAGNVYVADQVAGLIRKITPAGVVTTFAGNGSAGAVNGTGAAASFYYPFGLTLDAAGNLYVADEYNSLIRRITPAGVVSTVAGGKSGLIDGTGSTAGFGSPTYIINDGTGNLYVCDQNSAVRKVSAVGYNVSPALPAGLTFDPVTGNIAGVPTLAVTAADTVSAYNIGGSSSSVINITVTGPATAPTTVAAPVISYATPQTYTSGTAIAPLTPTNTGGAVPATIYGQVSTFTGSGATGRNDGPATTATFNQPGASVADAFGNLYVFDQTNYIIRKISPSGIVSTFAGSGAYGAANGAGTAASFSNVQSLAIDASGNLYAADEANQLIRKITPAGVVSTLAGSGSAAFANGTGTAASFYNPTGVAADASGNLYVADQQNYMIRKIVIATGAVTTYAGSGSYGSYGTDNGTGTSASFANPNSIAIDASGNLYVTEAANNDIRKINTGKAVTTFAGNGTAGFNDGTGIAASFSAVNQITIDKVGNLYVLDLPNNLVRKITSAGVVSTIAGNSSAGFANNVGTAATFNGMAGIAADASGNLFVSETTNNVIRKIAVSGYAVDNALPAGLTFNSATGTITGTPTSPLVSTTYSITAYNGGGSSTATLGITVSGTAVTPVAVTPPNISYATPQSYTAGTTISALTPTNSGGAVPAQIYGKVTTIITAPANVSPYGLAIDASGNLYAASSYKIYKFNQAGIGSVLVGSGVAGAVNGKGTAASFNMNQGQEGIAFDAQGNLYLADNGNNLIRKVSPSGVVTTYAGKTTAGATNGAIASATFNNPVGIAIDLSGNIYIADLGNYLIRKITAAGVVSTLAGSVANGGTSTDGTGTAASFSSPQGITVDANGNVYVSDSNEIRKITPGGIVTTLAGSTTAGYADGTGTAATFSNPYGLTIDAAGNIYATDNYSVRKITAAGAVTTLAGSGTGGGSGDGIGASAYIGTNVYGITFDGQGNLYITADGSYIRKVSIAGYTLNTPLPAGLVFDATTGTITGTPVLAITAANYSVTAYNTGGSSTANVNIAVTGTLPVISSPVTPPIISYAPATNSYTAGTVVSPLSPANSGGAVPAMIYGKTTTLKGTGAIGSPTGIGADAYGNIYLTNGNSIYIITSAGTVSILAGTGVTGFANGQGTAASFNNPYAVAVDAQGNKYVADYSNNAIRKISPAGLVTTLAGTGTSGYVDGPGTSAQFSSPTGVAVDAYGNVYVSDTYNNAIRKITPAGEVSTLAGGQTSGSVNGTGSAASFSSPYDVAVDANGIVYVADLGNSQVRKITPAGVVTTLAGSGTSGTLDGPGTAATFSGMNGIAVDLAGNVYVTDTYIIRKITPLGVVTTIAGTASSYGTIDGVGPTALFTSNPQGIAVDASGNVYVADGTAIRKISAVGYSISGTLPAGLNFDATTGIITGMPLVATATTNYSVSGYNMGGGSTTPVTFTVTAGGTAPALPSVPAFTYATPKVYAVGQPISSLQPANTGGVVPAAIYGQTSTFAGSGSAGNIDGTGAMAGFNAPAGMATDVYGNVYVADLTNNTIRRISPAGAVTTVAGNGTSGFANGTGAAAMFSSPIALAVDNNFNIYVADQYNSKIRKITPAGVVTTLAGNGTYGFVNNSNGSSAEFAYPTGVAVDASGNVYVADGNNQKIRKITPAGAVSTFAGSGTAGYVPGSGASASFNYPGSLGIDAAGNLYVADLGNYVIRKITPAAGVTTFAGSGASGSNDGTATTATFSGQFYITSVDAGGNVYVADAGNNLIRKVSPAGVVTTIAGSGTAGFANGVGSAASFASPQSAVADNNGNLYVADATNELIRKVNISGYTLNTFAPEGLSFDGTTGIFSGTPTAQSPASTYTVTGYNSAGAGTATLSIAVIYPPVVTATATATVFASMGDITPVPVTIDNGLAVTDQSLTTLASATVSITGNFTTGQDVLGFTNVAATMGNIAGAFNSTTGILSLTSAGGTATVVQWQAALSAVTYNNTNNVSPNTASRTIAFIVNDGTFNSATATKTINLTYTPSHNDNLAGISVSKGTLSPAFAATTTTYAFGVSNSVSALTVTASSVSLNATISINGGTGQLATASSSVALAVGSNAVTVKVTAQDGVTIQTYTLNITRAATQTITFAATNAVTYGAADFAPGATSTNTTLPITYTSSNANVATIVNGNIHIIGAGTTNITAAQAGNINYDPATSVVQALTVNPALLTITPANQSQVYGAVTITLTPTFSGFVNGDTQASLSISPNAQPNLSTAATTTSGVGTYQITANGAVDANYTITYVAGTFTITQASLTITANNATKVYGAVNPTFTASYSGFVNGDSQATLNTQPNSLPNLSTTATTASGVGAYPITAGSAVDPNYAISYVGGTLSVTPAALTITANSLSKSYGAVNPTLTASYSGLVNGDPQTSITGLQITTTATTNSPVGTYPITVSGGTSPNYTISFVNGTLTVNSVPIIFNTIASQVYGTADFSPGATSTASITYTSSNIAVATIVSGNIHIIAPGTSTITANDGSATASQTLTVTPAPLTITAANATKVYGAAIPTLNATYTGLVNSDSPTTALTTLPTLTPGATVASAVGSYQITASGAASTKYTLTYVTGTLTITQAPLTITANNLSKPSGVANPTLIATYTGLVNGDAAGVVTGLSITTTATSSSAPGTYPITVTGGSATNYSITDVNGTLTVTAATMSFSAIPSKVYGTADFNGGAVSNSTITYTSSNTSVATILSGNIHIIGVGTSTITANDGTTILQQTLTVTQAALTITANNQTKIYGAAIPALTVAVSGLVNGDTQSALGANLTAGTTATATSAVGTYPITASGAVDANYSISYVAGTLTVTTATLTVTAANATKIYGAANPAFTVSYSGFVNGDTQFKLTNQPTATSAATTASAAGTYPITAAGGASSNYSFVYVAGTLTVTPATLTVTAANASKIYGAANPAFTVSYAGFVNGDTQAKLTTQPTATSAATAASAVGSYPITAAGGASPNYTFVYVAGTLTVTTATLTVTAANASKIYGAANPAFTVSYAGFVNGDTQAKLTTQPTATSAATAASAAGTYPITAAGGVSPNYSFVYVAGTLTVTAATLTVTAVNATKTYGAANPAFTVTYVGFVNGDTQAKLTTQPTATSAATAASAAGTYPITAAGGVSPNYSFVYVAGTLTVTTATLAVTAANASKIYGAANPAFTVSYSGFVNGDTQAKLTTQPTATSAATTASTAGTYTITASGGVSPNYSFVYVAGTLTVTPATLTVTAANASRTYGAANPAFTVSYTGFVNGDTQAKLTTQPTATSAATATSVVGTYPITAAGGVSTNYSFVYVAGTLTVSNAALTITANNQTKTSGAANPTLTVSYAGFVNGETQAVLKTLPTVTTTATTSSPAGTYPITASGAVAANYSISYVAGTLTVTNQVAPKITYTTPQSFTAGTTITPLTPVNTGGVVPATVYAQVSAFAGSGTQGSANGTGNAASFFSPQGMATDASGNIYVADVNNNLIRKISSAGTVTTFAGSGTAGFVDGTGTGASFNGPIGLAVDASGNVYVADLYNQSIRKITSAGVVTTLAGNGSAGSANGTGTAASFSYPRCLATDVAGNVYVTDQSNNLIRRVTPAGVVTTFAGNGAQASVNGTGTAASFDFPFGIAIDPSGNFYVSDYLDHLIRKITSAGVVTTFAGSGAQGSTNGTGAAASFNNPSGLATDPAGNVYVADFTNNIIRKITPAGVVTTLAGTGLTGATNGAGASASFYGPLGVVADTKGYLYVGDANNNLVRKIYYTGYGVSPTLPKGLAISTAGVISGTPTTGSPATVYTVTASNTSGTGSFNINIAVTGPPIISYPTAITFVSGKAINELTPVSTGGIIPTGGYGAATTFAGAVTAGSANGTGTAATFNHPFGAVTDGSGNIYIADQNNNLIRKITTAGVVTTLAGTGSAGAVNGTGTAASFNKPSGLAADASGNIYVADFGNGLIRMITPAGVVTTVAGAFKSPVDVAIDASGNIYAADKVDNIIQKLIPGGSVTTFASGFTTPDGIALDAAGDLYVADATNRISKITSTGTVTVFAGSGTAAYTNGTGTAAAFNNPAGLKVDAAGNIYVADLGNNVVRKITSVGLVTTLAGTGVSGALNGTGITATFNGLTGLAIDANNNLYVADAGNNLIRKVVDIGYGVVPTLPTGLSMTGNGIILGIPTKATPAKAYTITAYNVSGKGSSTITITVTGPPIITYATPQTYTTSVGITPLSPTNTGGTVPPGTYGSVTTFSGSTTSGAVNGTGTAASFNGPLGVATDGSGNIYVADQQNNLIRKITPAGVVTTLAGSGAQGFANGTGTAASFNHPTGLGVDQLGNVFVADQNNNLIRKITPAGVVTTFAGSGSAGFVNGSGTGASFNLPTVVALDASNNLYVTDLFNNAIRKITPAGVVTTFAGSGAAGSTNGTGTAASFHYPTGIAVDGSGTVYVADQLNNEIRKITYLGVVSTLAGSGATGSTDGPGAAATFNDPYAVTVDGSGNVYVADYNNNEIRLVSSLGVVTTIAGSTTAGSANGTGAVAGFNHPASVSLDGNGNLFVADYYNNEIRNVKVTGFTVTPALPAGLGLNPTTGVITGTPATLSASTTYSIKAYNGGGSGTTALKIAVIQGLPAPVISYTGPNSYTENTAIAALAPKNTGGAVPASIYGQVSAFAGSGTAGSADGTGAAASFYTPFGAAIDAAGNLYVADAYKGLIRKITSAGVVTTLAGSGTNGAANGTGTAASFYYPKGVAVDAAGNVYVADSQNNLIRKITPAGIVTTFAGSGAKGSVDGAGVAASFAFPSGIAVDDAGNVYVADSENNRIREITPSGVVTTIAGNGTAGAVNGPALSSSFNSPTGIAISPTGTIYVADTDNNLIRAISGGVVSTFAGSGSNGSANGTGASASFSSPEGVAIDLGSNLYVADESNVEIRKISPSGVVTVLAASGLSSVTGIYGQVFGVAINSSGILYITDSSNDIVMKVSTTGYSISAALPPGLNFNATTGVISGTPTAVVGATTYTVTAGNSSGSATADVSIGVVNSVNASTIPNIYTVGRVNDPYGTARDASGNLYVASPNDNVVYRVDGVTQAVTVIAGNGIAGYSGDGGPATSAQLNLGLSGVAVDATGNVYIGEYNNNTVRRVDATTHNITTIAGTGIAGNSGAGGAATAALLNGPGGITIDANNNIYIADENNGQILEINPTTQMISTVLAGLGFVERVALDGSGNMYFGDEGKYTINKYNLSTKTLSIIGGNGTYGNSGDGGPATSAQFEGPMSVTVDASGNVYVVDQSLYVIRKIDAATQKISTYAGTGTDGYTGDGASASLAEMSFLTDLVIDNNGYLYVGDNGNGAIRKIGGTLPSGSAPNIAYASPQAFTAGTAITSLSPSNSGGAVPAQAYATVTTFAGSGTHGNVNGTGTAASFNNPYGCAMDGLGNLYVADAANNVIRKISPAGVVSTFAGSGSGGYVNGTGTAASFSDPQGLASDASGNIYVADRGNYVIRKISPAGVVTTLAGSGTNGFVNGTGTAASFGAPSGIAVDASYNIYVSDPEYNVIRKITYAGVVTTYAGSGAMGFVNGTATAASFSDPGGMAIDASGNIYLADGNNRAIREITPGGTVTTFAGGAYGMADGTGTAATFEFPDDVTIDNFGNLYVADGNIIRRITLAGVVTTLAGNYQYTKVDGIGTAASFSSVYGLSVSTSNNLYVVDYGDDVIRDINLEGYGISPNLPAGLSFSGTTGTITGTPADVAPAATYTITAENTSGVSIVPLTISVENPVATQAPAISYTGPQTYVAGTAISTLTPTNTGGAVPAAVYAQVSTFAGSGTSGSANGTGTAASFSAPYGVATDAAGNVYVADGNANFIKKITPGGAVTTFAGSGSSGKANGTGTAASFNDPFGVAVDASGNVYVADSQNDLIRKITPAGVVSTLAGTGSSGKVNGTGTGASFFYPHGVAVDASGNVYVADLLNNLIRKISPAGVVTTLAGSGTAGYTEGTGTAGSFNNPQSVAVDASGNVYVADLGNNVIRKITAAGVVSTLAGSGTGGSANGTGAAASFSSPQNVAVDKAGNVYVSDGNNLIRKITPAGVVTTVAGGLNGGNQTSTPTNGVGTAASFNSPHGIALDADGDMYVADSGSLDIRKVNLTGYAVTPAIPGLAFDVTTGIISGTAKVIIPTTTYFITAYNTAGSSTASLTLTVNSATVKAPVIAYAGPQSYPVNTAITTLTPTNTGGAIPGTAAQAVSTFAGSGAIGALNGISTAATFNVGSGFVASDNSGNLYVLDAANYLIRKITPAGVVTTLAGSGSQGQVNGTGTAASFYIPNGITVDASGNVYVADFTSIRKISPAGVVITLATVPYGGLVGLTCDPAGNVYIACSDQRIIDKITPAGVVTTIATDINNLNFISALTIDASGNLYGANGLNFAIEKITQAGVVTTFAGTYIDGLLGLNQGLTIDASGNLYMTDSNHGLIRKITPAGVVTTIAGTGATGLNNATAATSTFNNPTSIALDAAGNQYIVDAGNNMIRKIGTTGYTISPALPAGLTLNPNTGAITGTPTAVTAATTYTITAYNSGGTATTTVSIAVTATGLTHIAAKTYGAPDFSLGKTTNSPVPVSSSNAAVATIVGGKVHITGVGSSEISMEANGATTTQTLTVKPAPLTIVTNDRFKKAGSEIPSLTVNYTGFVNGETEDVLTVKPTITTDATLESGAGEYAIKVSGAVAPNYEITYNTGKLIITAADGEVTKTGIAVTNEQPGLDLANVPVVRQAVSPNGDGVNDVLEIDNIANFPDNKLELISRDGVKIFEAEHYDNVNHPFDGHSSITGRMQLPGTYFYLLEYRVKGELKRKTGFFILKY